MLCVFDLNLLGIFSLNCEGHTKKKLTLYMMRVVLNSVKYISYLTVLLSHCFFFLHSPYHIYVMG